MKVDYFLVGGDSAGDIIRFADKKIGDSFTVMISHDNGGLISNDLYTVTSYTLKSNPSILVAAKSGMSESDIISAINSAII